MSSHIALYLFSGVVVQRVAAVCTYVDPKSAPPEQCYQYPEDCSRLTDPSWKPDKMNGKARGSQVLAYAYGPLYSGNEKHVAAWKYDDFYKSDQKIYFWWSRPECMGMTSEKCTAGTKSNLEKDKNRLKKMNPKEGTKVRPNGKVEISNFGEFILWTDGMDKTGLRRLRHNQCYLDHIYVCSANEFVIKSFDAAGDPCDAAGEPLPPGASSTSKPAGAGGDGDGDGVTTVTPDGDGVNGTTVTPDTKKDTGFPMIWVIVGAFLGVAVLIGGLIAFILCRGSEDEPPARDALVGSEMQYTQWPTEHYNPPPPHQWGSPPPPPPPQSAFASYGPYSSQGGPYSSQGGVGGTITVEVGMHGPRGYEVSQEVVRF